MEMTPVDLKEELIQSGKMHYSDMLSQNQSRPAGTDLFTRALDSGAARLAREVSYLARELARRAGDEPIVWSARSELVFHWGHAASGSACDGKTVFPLRISIIRDRVLMLRRLILSNHAMVLMA